MDVIGCCVTHRFVSLCLRYGWSLGFWFLWRFCRFIIVICYCLGLARHFSLFIVFLDARWNIIHKILIFINNFKAYFYLWLSILTWSLPLLPLLLLQSHQSAGTQRAFNFIDNAYPLRSTSNWCSWSLIFWFWGRVFSHSFSVFVYVVSTRYRIRPLSLGDVF